MWAVVGTLCALAAASPGAPAASTASFTLDNGLRVVIRQDRRAPLVAVNVVYRVGAAMDGDRPGLAHLVEHLSFEGSPNAPDSAGDRWLEAAGGISDGATGADTLRLSSIAPAEALELILFLESDRMLGLRIDAADLENQRLIVAQELAGRLAAPGGALPWARLMVRFAPGHPYRSPAAGLEVSLSAITLEEVEEFHARHMGPGDAALAIVGDVELAAAEALVRRWFDEVPARTVSPLPAVPDAFAPAEWLWPTDVYTPSLSLIWPTVPAGHSDEPAFDLLAEILAGGEGGALDEVFGRARHHRLDASARTENGRLAGSLVLTLRPAEDWDHGWFERPPFDLGRAQAEAVLHRIAAQGPTEAELARAKRRDEMARLRASASVEAMARDLGECLLSSGRTDCGETGLAAHQAVSAADIQRVAAALVEPAALFMAPLSLAAAFESPQSVLLALP